MQENLSGGKGSCSCFHHQVISCLVIVFGLVFLAPQIGWLSSNAVNWLWPVIVILAGLHSLVSNKCKCC